MADTNLRIKIGMQGSAEVSAGLKSIADASSKLKGMLVGVGAAIAGAAGLAALGQAAVNTAKLGGELSDLAARTGISVRALVTLRQAFNDAGAGADSVGGTINRLQKTIYEAATAGGAASDAISVLGLSTDALIKLAPEDQFSQVAAAISKIENPAQRSAAAMAIFGKSGAELLPLFADGGALDAAKNALGNLPDLLSRNVGILDSISDRFDRLGLKATQLFAGIFDELGGSVDAFLAKIESIDLTGLGQNIGAFVNLAIKAFEDGRLGEFIGFTIRVGTEIGIQAFKDLSKSAVGFLTDESVANAIGNFSVSLVAGIGKAFIELNQFFMSYWNAVGIYAADAISSAVRYSLNQQIAAAEAVINASKAAVRLLVPGGAIISSQQINLPRVQQTVPNFDAALGTGSQIAAKHAEIQAALVDKMVFAYRDFFGISTQKTTEDGKQISLAQEFLNLLKKQREETEAKKKAEAAPSGGVAGGETPINLKLELMRLEMTYNKQLQQINQARGAVESSWLMTNLEKYQEKKQLMQSELDLIARQIKELEKLKATATETERVQIEQRMVGLQGTAGGVENQMTAMGPSPESFSQNFQSTVVQLQNQFGTVAQQMATTFADVFNSAISSISNGITGLIMGTMSWGQALAMIGTTILTTIVQSIVQMGVRWVATQILMATVGKSIMAASLAATVPIALASSAIWATPATLATIASYGSAAAAAPGFILGAQGMVLAQSLAAFKTGGYTGNGNPNDVAGLVHRGEFVVPADAVDRIGVSSLQAMTSGAASDAGAFTSSAAPSPITLNMGVFDNPGRLNDWAKSNEGRTVLVDLMRQHAHEFSRA
jgi:hypothetical protein